jgi:AraC family ethanolamine operon transcriptional activator
MTKQVREMHFSDPDEAATAIRATKVEFSLLAPSSMPWRVGEADLAGSSLWWGQLGASSSSVGMMEGDASLFVIAGSDARDWTINRCSLGERDLAFLPGGGEYACSYPVPGSWFALAFPRAWLEREAGIHLPEGFEFAEEVSTFDLARKSARVRRAFSIATSFASCNADLLVDCDTRASLQRALVTTVLGALELETDRPARRDQKLFSKLLGYFHDHPREAIHQADLCRALSTTTRALRRVFPEAFGTTPGKYLRLRRLHLARRALLAGWFPSVTTAAVHFGFFDLGRFAASYRALFGENPSQSLARTSCGTAS